MLKMKKYKRVLALVLTVAITLTLIWNENLFPLKKTLAETTNEDIKTTYDIDVKATVGGNEYQSGTVTNEDVTVVITVDDSSVKNLQYKLENAGEYNDFESIDGYSLALSAAEGDEGDIETIIYLRGVDDDGNELFTDYEASVTVTRDKVGPTISSVDVTTTDGSVLTDEATNQDVVIKISGVTDGKSNISNVYVKKGETTENAERVEDDGEVYYTHNVTVSGMEETEHIYTVWAVDALGNEGAVKEVSFTYDKTGPQGELTVTMSELVDGATNEDVTLTITGMSDDTKKVYVQQTDGEAKEATKSEDGTSYTYVVSKDKLTSGKTYEYSIWAVDALGNEGDKKTATFTYDNEGPQGDLTVVMSDVVEGATNKDVTITITGMSDDTKKVYVQQTDGEAKEATKSEDGTSYTYVVSKDKLTSGKTYEYSIWAVDALGNEGDKKTATFTYDNEGPQGDLTVLMSNVEEGATNKDVTITITGMSDDTEKVYVQLGDEEAKEATKSQDGKSYTYEILKEGLTPEETYEYTIWAVDALGNEGKKETVSFTYDTNGPAADLTVDMNKLVDGKANDNVTITITGMSDDTKKVYIQQGDGEVESATESEDGLSYTYVVSKENLTSGTTYEYKVWAVDALENPGTVKTVSFIYDTDAPIYNVSMSTEDTNPLADGAATNKNVVLSITKNEFCEDTATVYVKLKGADDEKKAEATGDYITGYSYTIDITNFEAGSYIYQVWAVDKLGNECEAVEVSFVYDNVGPSCDVSMSTEDGSLDNGASTNKNVKLTVSSTEDFKAFYVKEKGADDSTKEEITEDAEGKYTLSFDNLTNGTTYEYNIWAVDALGNPGAEKTVSFVYDTDGPEVTVSMSTERGGLSEGASTNSDVTLSFLDIPEDTDSIYVKGENDTAETKVTGNSHTIDVDVLQSGNTYTYTIWAIDKTGNRGDEQTISFVYDNVAPVISTTYDSDGIWINEHKDIVITVTDALSNIQKVTYKIGENEEKTATLDGEGKFTIEGEDLLEGNYAIEIIAVDVAGNESEAYKINVCKDMTAPDSNVKFTLDKEYSYSNIFVDSDTVTLSTKLMVNVNPKFILNITDENSGVKEVYNYTYDCASGDFNKTDVEAISNWKTVTITPSNSINVDVTEGWKEAYEESKKLVEIFKVVDTAGNISYVASDWMWFDETAPDIATDYAYDDSWTKEKVDIKVTVTDDLSDVATITYKLGDNEEVSVSVNDLVDGTFTISKDSLVDGKYSLSITAYDNAGNMGQKNITIKKDTSEKRPEIDYEKNNVWTNTESDIVVTLIDELSGIKSITYKIGDGENVSVATNELKNGKFTISKDKLDVGQYDVVVTVTDNEDNSNENKVTVMIDKTLPTSDLSYTKDGEWTKEVLDITATVADELSGIKSITYKIGDKVEVPVAIDELKDGKFTISSEDLEAGNYNVVLTVYDNAGNSNTDTVVVMKDRTEPTADLSYDKDNAWTNEVLDITATVADELSGIASITYQIGTNAAVSVLASDLKDGKFTISSEDLEAGNYNVVLTVYDNAGNSNTDTVVVMKDRTEPTADLSYAKDNVWTNEDLDITATVADELSGISSIEYQIGTNAAVSVSVNDLENGTFTIPSSKLAEGNYKVVLTVYDNAGNYNTDTIVVKKDKINSTAGLSYEKDNAWTNEDLDITATLADELSGITSITYQVGTNAAVSVLASDLKDGKFTIPSTELAEGKYDVILTVYDEAGNYNTDTVVVKKDKTASVPTLIYTKDDVWTNEDINITSTITDELSGINTIQYTINNVYGEKITVEADMTLSKNDVVIPASALKEGLYEVTIIVKDYAGNESTDTVIVKKDKTESVPNLIYTSDDKWTNKDLDITSTIKDELSGIHTIQYTIDGVVGEEIIVTPDKTLNKNDVVIPSSELKEGLYNVTITVKDYAGNESTDTVIVKKDKTASIPTLIYASDDVWTNKDLDITSTITDELSGIHTIQYAIDGVDGEVITVTPDKTLSKNDVMIPSSALKEGLYNVTITVKDYAGNESTDTVIVKKDKTPSIPTLIYASDDVWTNKDLNITSTITDELSGIHTIQYIIDGVDGEVITVTPDKTLSKNDVTILASALKEGLYNVTITVKDYAGNENTDTVIVKKDKTASVPTLIYASDDVWTQDELDITSTITDELSGIHTIQYAIGGVNGELITIAEDKLLSKNDVAILASALSEGDYEVVITVKDHAGNESTDKVVVKKDKTIVKPNVTYNSEGVWTNKLLDVTGSVEDSLSGIKSVKWIIDGVEKEIKTFDEAEVLTFDDIKLTSSELAEGDYEVTLVLEDYVGHTSETTINVKKDISIVEPTLNYASDDVWTQELLDITGSVEDSLSGIKDVKWIIDGVEKEIKTFEEIEVLSFEDILLTAEELAEGDYEVTLLFNDHAGNEISSTITVKKDTSIVAPVLNYAKNGTWTNELLEITGSVKDDLSGIKTVKWIVNGEEKAIKSFTEVEVLTFDDIKLTASELVEGNYEVTLVLIDQVGHESKTTVTVKKDTTKPLPSLSYAKDNTWTNAELDITGIVTEERSGIKSISYTIDGVKTDVVTKQQDGTFEWDDITISSAQLKEGLYKVILTVYDYAGNSNIYTVNVKKDTTEATGSVALGTQGTWTNFFNTVTFNLFAKETQKVTLTANDVAKSGVNETSKIASVQYIRTSKIYGSEAELNNVTNWTNAGTNVNNTAFTGSFNVEPNENLIVYVKITDYAGNVQYFNSNGMVLDSAKSEGDITKPIATITAKPITNDIYSDSIVADFKVIDPIIAGSVTSGIKTITYRIVNNDTGYETAPVTIDVKSIAGSKPSLDLLKNISEYSGKIEVSKEQFNSNNVVIKLNAEDNAGNMMTEVTAPLKIDATAPTVNVSYNNNDVGGYEKYFNDARTMQIVVTERNFDPAQAVITITRDGVATAVNGSTLNWTLSDSNSGANGDGNTYTTTYPITEDGDYTVSMTCSDMAANVASSIEYAGVATQEFTIDNINPVITATAVAGHYNSAQTITITINEHNFMSGDVKVEVNDEARILNWADNGDVRTATITFADDNDYKFKVNYVDMAGRSASTYFSNEFTIDNINPEIISPITAESNNKANKKDVYYEYKFFDVNLRDFVETLEYHVYAWDEDSVEYEEVNWLPSNNSITNEAGVNGYSLIFTDSTSADGLYKLVMKVTDESGRSTEIIDEFTINRDGSVYKNNIKPETYTKKVEENIVVDIYNSNLLTGYEVVVYNNLTGQKYLVENTDYKIEPASDNGNGWMHYVCTIYPEVFVENGTYSIVIMAKDEADDQEYSENAALNSSETGNNKLELTFTVDNIDPELTISGAKDGESYDIATDLKVEYSDVSDITSIKIERINEDGETIDTKEYSAKEIEDLGLTSGSLTYTVEEYDGFQTIKVTIIDKANNDVSKEIRILVTSNAWIKFINNTPLLIGTGAGILLVAAMIIFIIVKKKKKKSEE